MLGVSPLVSIIITTYNRPAYLKETLISINSQTYSNFEVLVIDDGSNTKNFSQNERIVNQFTKFDYYFKANTGQPDSRNYGIKKSRGKYIAFCDDDDIWVREKLEIQVNILEENPDYDMTTGCIGYIDKDSNIIKEKLKCHKGYNHGYVFDHFLIKNRTSSITPMLRYEVFHKVGYFDPSYRLAEDWEFWRRLSYVSKFYYYDSILAYVRVHGKNMSITDVQNNASRIFLFYKLSRSLERWGKDDFDKNIFKKIENSEKHKYKLLISNNFNHKDKFLFFMKGLFSSPSKTIHILMLYISSVLISKKR
jgi:glycosyltransferase involved in cell wall biosynthesis